MTATVANALPHAALPDLDIVAALAAELSLKPDQVQVTLALLAEGATVPFLARYRKERTGGLDEVQIRELEERSEALRELDKRRQAVWASIADQGKATEELRRKLLAAQNKSEVEDLYLPFRPKRRTRASMARERGLEPLALRLLAQGSQGDPRREAAAFVQPDKDVADVEAALAGARDIAAEILSESAPIRAAVRQLALREGVVTSKLNPKHQDPTDRFREFKDYGELAQRLPAHRYLALCRGEAEEALKVSLEIATERALNAVLPLAGWQLRSPWADQLRQAAEDGIDRLLWPSLQSELRGEMKAWADRSAVEVFAKNLGQLLMQAPFGGKAVLGIDPGLRTGCKCAAVDATGALRGHATIYPHTGGAAAAKAGPDLLAMVKRFQPTALAIGNGTGGRETEAFAKQILREAGLSDLQVVMVSEAGASVYSASEVARQEFPDLDLTVRGAISIARRLQDPLAELVQLEPKAIGVGQYQHDVDQKLLGQKLNEVVESCVNQVGVELNTASGSLLSHVAGIGPALAKKIVAHRTAQGPFASRKALLKVSGLGPKAFEQCAGFLRIRGGDHPLDASAVHPERYSLVEQMAKDLGVGVAQLVGRPELSQKLELQRYAKGDVGEPTLRDILAELGRPGRDPRASFESVQFREDIKTMADLRPGMTLTGVVTNVTAFGAFVDIGVHQDGLVHVSQLADQFVRDPHEVAQVGQRLQVRVLEVDIARKRISLSAKKGQATQELRPGSR